MTDNGKEGLLKELIKRIKEKTVDPPMDLNSNDLKQWLIGYMWGQVDAINIIEEFMEGQKN